MTSEPQPEIVEKTWPDYRAVWRWHFYASLFCIPFVIILSISGAIYLFKDEVESWQDRPYDNLVIHGKPATAAAQIRAALAAVPDATFDGYEIPKSDHAAARVIVRSPGGAALRVYVHPETLQVVHTIAEDERLMQFVKRVHGELLSGDRGSMVVELAASWTIVMVLTGLYLWWPRHARRLAGVLYPRLGGGRRMFWRDVHGVTGIWISAFVLFLLLTGLPWAKSWGNYFKAMRRVTGTAVARQDWTTGSESTRAGGGGPGDSGGHAGHHWGSGRRAARKTPKDLSAVDRIVATVRPLALPAPVVIAPPARGTSNWTAKSLTANRPLRVDLVVDGKTGEIVSRQDFRNRHPVDRVVAIGIAAHEGRLFGWANQVLGLLTAIGLDTMCLSGLILWWRRRGQGVLGAPRATLRPRISIGLVTLVLLLGLYLPLFGASLVAVLLVERIVLSRIPRLRDWLGLYAPPATVTT
jgi:uncharacterized iron-regulated membrane protein